MRDSARTLLRAPEVKFTVDVRDKSRVQSYNMLRDLNFTSMEIYATAPTYYFTFIIQGNK